MIYRSSNFHFFGFARQVRGRLPCEFFGGLCSGKQLGQDGTPLGGLPPESLPQTGRGTEGAGRGIHLPDVLWPVGDTIRVSQSEKYSLLYVDNCWYAFCTIQTLFVYGHVVVLEQPATTYEENCHQPDGLPQFFHAAPQQPEVLKEDEAITKEFHRSALSIQVDFGRYRPGGIWAALMIFSTVYLCISTVYLCLGDPSSEVSFFFRLYVIHGVISCSKWEWV